MTTELRELLASAADDTTPHDLAGRATASARRRRQGRLAVAGSVAAVTVLVAGAVVLGPLQQTGDEPRPQDVASLPVPDALPELSAGTMDAASVAYVADDQLVLVDASSGQGAVWNDFAAPEGFDMDALRPYQVRLSPDGAVALVAMRFESSQRLLGIRVAVLDVATAESSVEDLQLSDAHAESAWLEYNLMAWAPDSKAAYCVCLGGDGTDPVLGVWSISVGDTPIDTFYSQLSELFPAQISADAVGVAVQLESGGEWVRLDDKGEPTALPVMGQTVQAALSHGDEMLVAAVNDSRYGIEPVDRFPMRTGWQPLPAGPVSSVQALGSYFVLVSRPLDAPAGEPAPPSPLYAHRLTQNADPQLFTTFPTGTTSTSFATAVDAIG